MYLRGLKVFRGRNVQEILMIGAHQVEASGKTLTEYIRKTEKAKRWIPDETVIDYQSQYERDHFRAA